MNISFQSDHLNLIVHISGEIDHHSSEMIRNKIDDMIEINQYKGLILDFSSVSFMDSSGIGVIIGRMKKITLKGGKIFIVNPKIQIKNLLEMAGMTKIIPIMDSVEDAIEAV